MHRNDFTNTLAHEGFQTLVTATREPFSSLDVYIHPFGAQALVLEDAFSSPLPVWSGNIGRAVRFICLRCCYIPSASDPKA